MANYIGIDLGTTNSAVSVLDETGKPRIVHNQDGGNTTPSVITFTDKHSYYIGEEAYKNLANNESNTFGRFKRHMGTSKTYDVFGKTHTPESLSALLLKKIKEDTEKQVGSITKAVVTIPANFANEAREATLNAAKVAGLNVEYIINEPTAAALYYAFSSGKKLNGNYVVYDLGGGTFDVSVISVKDDDISVLATEGVNRLGGDDFDKKLQDFIGTEFESNTSQKLDVIEYNTISAEEDKKSLSKKDTVKVRCFSKDGSSRQNIEVSKQQFEESISSLIAQTEMLCETVLDDASVKTTDINAVFLVGGSTRIPCIAESVERVFGIKPDTSANPDEVVALGASLYAAYKAGGLGLNNEQQETFKNMNVGEITSKYFGTLSLGIDEDKEQMSLTNDVIIEKGQKIPYEKEITVYTAIDNQTRVQCRVTESNTHETDPDFVKIIWDGDLELPANRPAGQKVMIKYSYDDNQIMKCSFMDVESGKKTEVDLSMNDNQSDIDIEKFTVA